MIVGEIEHWAKYMNVAEGDPSYAVWHYVFEYLASLGPDSPETDMAPLRGDEIMARVMVYETEAGGGGVIEAHDRYVDIQASLSGTEGVAWYPRVELETKEPYDLASDAVFFEAPERPAALVHNAPGVFTVLYPNDAHMTQWAVGDPERVKKVVMKVRADLLG